MNSVEEVFGIVYRLYRNGARIDPCRTAGVVKRREDYPLFSRSDVRNPYCLRKIRLANQISENGTFKPIRFVQNQHIWFYDFFCGSRGGRGRVELLEAYIVKWSKKINEKQVYHTSKDSFPPWDILIFVSYKTSTAK